MASGIVTFRLRPGELRPGIHVRSAQAPDGWHVPHPLLVIICPHVLQYQPYLLQPCAGDTKYVRQPWPIAERMPLEVLPSSKTFLGITDMRVDIGSRNKSSSMDRSEAAATR